MKHLFRNTILILFIFCLPIIVLPLKKHHYFIHYKNIPSSLSKTTFISVNKNKMFLLSSNLRYQIIFSYPFTDYNFNSYTVNYNNQGDIALYKDQYLLLQKKHSLSYPRIAYPYIIYFHPNLRSADIYSLQHPRKKITSIHTRSIITSWSQSTLSRYIILSDLKGYIYIYDTVNKQKNILYHKDIKFIQGVSISKNHILYAIGNNSPKIIYSYSLKSHDSSIITTHLDSHSSIHLFTSSNLLFLPYKKGFQLFKQNSSSLILSHQIKSYFYRLIYVSSLYSKRKHTLILYQVDSNTYYVQILNKYYQTIDRFYFTSKSIPSLKRIKSYTYISYDRGIIKIC